MAFQDEMGNFYGDGSSQNAEPKNSSQPAVPPKVLSGPLYTSRERTSFSNTKYNIEQHSYPEDIMSFQYGGNYVIFYINVAEESKLFNDKTVETVADFPTRDRSGMIAMNQKLYDDPTSGKAKTAFVGLNAAGQVVEGAAAGGLLAGKVGALGGAALNAAPAAIGIGAAATQAASVTRAQKRLKTAIALHIPNQLNIRYGVSWGEEDTFSYQAAAAGAEAILKALDGGGAKNLGNDAAAIVGSMGLKSDKQGAAASAAFGLASNPKKEQVFKNVDFRTFQFDYQFFPRNSAEAENVMRIIHEFKYHMHPEFKDANEFLYVYPSEFDISYYQNGEENKNLHRHTSCVLTEMNVNYTPNGQFNSFENGMPTQINITLSFRELSLLTKDKIKDGL
jgi:hypothetical protein